MYDSCPENKDSDAYGAMSKMFEIHKEYLEMYLLVFSLLLGGSLSFGCNLGGSTKGDDTNSDGDTDADTDTDSDSDSDADTDSDTDTDADTDTDPESDIESCDSDLSVISTSLSPAIPTVGIIEWSSSLDTIEKATIEFGLDTDYGYTASVDLNKVNYRTLLLGMKSSSTYHYRIVVTADQKVCEGRDHTIDSGPLAVGLPRLTISVSNPSEVTGGFLVTSLLGTPTALILDKDGDVVWWYEFESGSPEVNDGLSRAKISSDGKSMWAANPNVFPGGESGGGFLYKIPMDGLGEQETIAAERHHDFAVLPDDGIAYIEFTASDGDRIVERNSSGETTVVYTLGNDFEGRTGPDWSHCNAIHYIPADDAYTLSCLTLNAVIKVSRSGALLWTLEGDGNSGDFSGVSWSSQHGHELLGNGHLLFFNNGESGFGARSIAKEYALDEIAGVAHDIWNYDGAQYTANFGDVQHSAINGNILVDYSLAGIIHEVDRLGNTVRTITVSSPLGYMDWRSSLYGPPNRW